MELTVARLRQLGMSKREIFWGAMLSLLIGACMPVATPFSAAADRLASPSTAPIVLVAPSPTPTLYRDIWVSGYIFDHHLEIGNASADLPIDERYDVSIESANTSVAAMLAALPPGDVLVVLEGDFTPGREPLAGSLLVRHVRQVSLPYTFDMPLDATYYHERPAFSLDFPGDWYVATPAPSGPIIISNSPPDSNSLRPGREHDDPTQVFVSIHTVYFGPLDDYLTYHVHTTTQSVVLGGREFVRIQTEGLGIFYDYMTEIGGRVVAFTVQDNDAPFAERVLTTLH